MLGESPFTKCYDPQKRGRLFCLYIAGTFRSGFICFPSEVTLDAVVTITGLFLYLFIGAYSHWAGAHTVVVTIAMEVDKNFISQNSYVMMQHHLDFRLEMDFL